MKKPMIAVAAAAITLTAATASQAATFVYQLGDHPDGALSSSFDYGLRLDRELPDPRFFSFSNGNTTLTYNDVTGVAVIAGTVVESLPSSLTGSTFDINYTLTGLTDLGGGGFVDRAGNGSGVLSGAGIDGTDLELGTSQRTSGPLAGVYFLFGLDALADRPFTGFEGTGWVQSDPGANDFLFTAQIAPVPLPAAGLMLLTAVGGMGVMRRRKTKS